jgi:SPP1 family predicted phage head-tail adaptor
MRAGRLRESVVLQSKTVTRDAYGAEVITWTTQATVWADAQPLSGREYVAIRQSQSDISIRFRMRYLSGVNTGWRVQWRSRNYDIVEAIDVDARGEQLEILCTGDAGNV